MKIHILFGQRRCSYPGQYAPEALACMDDAGYSENPDYLDSLKQKHEQDSDFVAVQVITVEVDDNEVDSRLFPAKDPIPGRVS